MIKLKNKFAIGCLVQWYEIEVINEYIESVKQSLETIDNKKNVIVDICVNLSQELEKVKDDISLGDIANRFYILEKSLRNKGYVVNVDYKLEGIYTIADYRRDFNTKYCHITDVLMWGETDALIPKQTFEIIDNLHESVHHQTPKYVATFGICKMWDESWKPVEHTDFTDKPFIEDDYDNWWSLKYTMSLEEMYKINDKVGELDVTVLNNFKFNGCGLIFSSEIVKCGVNIPESVFFVHEDTAFQNFMISLYGNTIPQYVIKNVLIVHNRNHPDKRMYIKDEREDGTMNEKRRSNEWYVKANKMSEHNAYNFMNQQKMFTWEDVYE
tara:strand:- start:694 stop:1671 length:978 start_codon:yes stop_codon:yes gene_type:complete